MPDDQDYLRRCLQLASKSRGYVSPNPLVGCVIVKKNKIIAAGRHEFFGGPHAEMNAFHNASAGVSGATLYVNLEPCCHYGKTPPCVNTIIEKKIARVVIGTPDPNPLVGGQGIKKLKAAGISVVCGLLESECLELNKFFFKFIQHKSPYVTLKIAQTLDGKIATVTKDSKWITSEESRTRVHRMRAEYDAVLIGSGTARIDNPELTVRMISGRNPKRIILDGSLTLPLSLKLFRENPERNVFIAAGKDSVVSQVKKVSALEKLGVHLLPVSRGKDGRINLKELLRTLGKQDIASVMVEGGGEIYTSFLKAGLADEINMFIAPKIFGSGISAFSELAVNKASASRSFRLHNSISSGTDVFLDLRHH